MRKNQEMRECPDGKTRLFTHGHREGFGGWTVRCIVDVADLEGLDLEATYDMREWAEENLDMFYYSARVNGGRYAHQPTWSPGPTSSSVVFEWEGGLDV